MSFPKMSAQPSKQNTGVGVFHNLERAWRGTLSELFHRGHRVPGVSDPRSIGSGFGTTERSTRELMGQVLTIESPRDRLIQSRNRRIDLSYGIANVIWVLSGSAEAE